MPRIIVLPAREDQVAAANGRVPRNHFDCTFGTEAEAYVDGVESMSDLAEYEVVAEDGATITVSFDGADAEVSFGSEAEKVAYKQGLEAGDGFASALCLDESHPDFAAVAALVGDPPAAPAAYPSALP